MADTRRTWNDIVNKLHKRSDEDRIILLEDEILFLSNTIKQISEQIEKTDKCWIMIYRHLELDIENCMEIINLCKKVIKQIERKIFLDKLNSMYYND